MPSIILAKTKCPGGLAANSFAARRSPTNFTIPQMMKATKTPNKTAEIAMGIQAEPIDDESLIRMLPPNK
jgi:hypothetical protein